MPSSLQPPFFILIFCFESKKVGWNSHSRVADPVICIDTNQNGGGSFPNIFQRIGDQTEPTPLALKNPLLLKLQ
jgi:hypothetical protein